MFGRNRAYADHRWATPFEDNDLWIAKDAFEDPSITPRYGRRVARNADGLVPDFSQLYSSSLPPGSVDDLIVEFYEHTSRFDMIVTKQEWSWWARPLGKVWRAWARFIQQLVVPIAGTPPFHVATEVDIYRLDGYVGLEEYRVWKREVVGHDTFYVAAFRPYRFENESYMSLAFPYPHANLSVTFLLTSVERGLAASVRGSSHAGSRIVFPNSSTFSWVRAPTEEAIRLRVGTTATGEPAIFATHTATMMGARAFLLEYEIHRRLPPSGR